MASSGEVTDCNQLNRAKKGFQSFVCGLSALGYCKNIELQRGRLHERRVAPSLDKKVHSKEITNVIQFIQ